MPKDQRDKLCRWIPEQSNDYLRAARPTVFGIQMKMARAMRNNNARLSEEETLDGLRSYLVTKQIMPEHSENIVDDLHWKGTAVADPSAAASTPKEPEGTETSEQILCEADPAGLG
eukprot:914261-Karenia_brevis.AAC.1